MGLRLTTAERVVAMFDSVTGWAFGPTFDTEEKAQEFLDWCERHGFSDLRAVPLPMIESLEKDFYAEQRKAGQDV